MVHYFEMVVLLYNYVIYISLLLCLCILIYVYLLLCMCCILFHCVVLCIVCVQMCTVLLSPCLNPIADKNIQGVS